MKIVCDACQAKYSIADDKIQGKAFKIRCKKCNHIIVVKTGGEGAAASSAAHAAAVAERPKAAAAAAAAAAAPAAEAGIWHVVVDGEQVGPLTVAEVKDRLRAGKINSDTLVWKEGFADWMQLSTVPEMTSLLARITRNPVGKSEGRDPSRQSGSMRAAGTAAPSAAEEDDPFAAPTVITPAGASDLFTSSASPSAAPAAVAPAPSSPFLFGGGAVSQPAEQVVIKNPGNGAGGTHLTGQRNENSVLFSLSNLEALAMPSHSAGIRPPSGSSVTEGSGLIDIRSMAAMTLNDGRPGEFRPGADSLPTFSTPQFSPVAPVLLPMSISGPPKWVYPVLGLLAVGILALGYGIYKIAAAPPPGVVVAPPPPPPAPPAPVPAQPVVANPSPAPTPEAANPATPEVKPSVEEKSSDKGKSVSSKGDKVHHKASDSGSSKGSGDSKKGAEPASTPPSTDSSSGKSSGKKGGKSLDDLLGEVGSKKIGGGEEKPAPPAVKLITLTQSDIVNAMKGVQPKVQACANQFKVPGTAMANISVVAGGRVGSATVTGKFAGTPTGSCVESAAKSAKFPPCQSMTFPWPFTLSPR
jgi:predicted Zn finger-like uncharacterized protein